MRIDSTKNTVNGIVFGGINKILMIIMPFVIRSVLIHKIGAEYAGLSSLFTSMLRVFNIAELGFTSAASYSLYKPIAEEDTEQICSLLSFYRRVFYTLGITIMIFGIVFTPFLDKLIYGTYPDDINLKLLYLLYIIDSATSYFLFSYKNLILYSYQRIDIVNIINIVVHIAMYSTQLVSLLVFHSYYGYVVSIVFASAANNVIISKIVSKRFPNYKCKGTLTKDKRTEIIRNSYGMVLFKICQVTRNSLDTMFISSYIGLYAAAVYNNYYQIFAGLIGILTIIRESMMGGIGNKIVLYSPEKNHSDMFTFMYLYAWLSGIMTACMLCLYQPFIKLWVGTKLMIDEVTMIAFCVYFYVSSMGSIRFLYHQAAGLFWAKRYWTVAEAMINIIGNYLLVRMLGMLGIVCSTIISLITVDFFYSTRIVYDNYFKNGKIGIYFKKHGLYLMITTLGCIPAYLICRQISLDGILGLIVRLVICLIISNSIFFIMYKRLPEYSDAMIIVKRVLDMLRKKVKV